MSYVNYHPIFLDLNGKSILIVGGGKVAMEKLDSMLATGAKISVVAPWATDEIRGWHQEGKLFFQQRVFEDADVRGHFMVIAATDDPVVNQRVFRLGDKDNRLANSVDDPENCNFIMSAITRRGPMQAAISSAGCSPALAQRLRKRIADEMLTTEMGELADFLGGWRSAVKERIHGYKRKQGFWESVIDSDIPGILAHDGRIAADLVFEKFLSAYENETVHTHGTVTLIGAGPGDPDLLTLKAVKALQSSDVVLYDRLTNPSMLRHAKRDALLIDVGKAPGECGRPRQETIHAMLIEHAKAGRRIARLKGGDPFVFGRGGEEIEALREAGVRYEIIPGISSSIAAASAAEIPVTHRGLSTGFAVFTAQGASECADTIPWEILRSLSTIVLLMGVEKLPDVVQKLRLVGFDDLLPIAVISHATLPTQQIAIGNLRNILELGATLPSPATIVIGEVVRLGKSGLSDFVENADTVWVH